MENSDLRISSDSAQNTLVTAGGNGPHYLIRPRRRATVSNHYLLAILNHPLSEAFVRTNTSPVRGGYYSHGKQFIETLPVPVPDDATRSSIEALVGKLINKLDDLAAAHIPRERIRLVRETTDLKSQIEQRVNQLFGSLITIRALSMQCQFPIDS